MPYQCVFFYEKRIVPRAHRLFTGSELQEDELSFDLNGKRFAELNYLNGFD